MEVHSSIPNSKVHGAYMGPTWGRQDPGGPHVGPMKLAIRDVNTMRLGWDGRRVFTGFVPSGRQAISLANVDKLHIAMNKPQ